MRLNCTDFNVAQTRLQNGSIEIAPYAQPIRWKALELNGFRYLTLFPSAMHDGSLPVARTATHFFERMFCGPAVEIPSEYAAHAEFDRNQHITLVRFQDRIELWRAKRYQYLLERMDESREERPMSRTTSISRRELFLPPNFYSKWGEDKLVIMPYYERESKSLVILPFEIFILLPKIIADTDFLRMYFSRGREARSHLGKVKLTDGELEHLGSLTHQEVSLLYNSNKVEISKANLELRIRALVNQSA